MGKSCSRPPHRGPFEPRARARGPGFELQHLARGAVPSGECSRSVCRGRHGRRFPFHMRDRHLVPAKARSKCLRMSARSKVPDTDRPPLQALAPDPALHGSSAARGRRPETGGVRDPAQSGVVRGGDGPESRECGRLTEQRRVPHPKRLPPVHARPSSGNGRCRRSEPPEILKGYRLSFFARGRRPVILRHDTLETDGPRSGRTHRPLLIGRLSPWIHSRVEPRAARARGNESRKSNGRTSPSPRLADDEAAILE